MKRLLIFLLIPIFVLSSCTLPDREDVKDTISQDSADTENSATEDTDTSVVATATLSISTQNSVTAAFRDAGFTISGMTLSEDGISAVYYVWADNYGNGTSLTLRDAEKLARDFCLENSLSENAITVEKGFYNSTDIGFPGGIEGIPDEEFSRLEAENHPLAEAITELCERNVTSYTLYLLDETLHIVPADGLSYTDLDEYTRFIVNEYIEYVTVEFPLSINK